MDRARPARRPGVPAWTGAAFWLASIPIGAAAQEGAWRGLPPFSPPTVAINTAMTFDLDALGFAFSPALALFDEPGNLVAVGSSVGDPATARVAALRLNAPGLYLASISGDPTGFTGGFGVSPMPGAGGGLWALSIEGSPAGIGQVAAGGVSWVGVQVRDEGPGLAVPGDFSPLRPLTLATQSPVDTSIAVHDLATGDLVASNDDFVFLDPDARLDLTLPPGSYRLAVTASGAGYADGLGVIARASHPLGGYSVSVGPLFTAGEGQLEAGGDADFFTFVVEAPVELGEVAESIQRYEIDTASSNIALDTHLAVWSAEGELFAADDDGGPGFNSRIVFAKGLPAGAYLASVAGGPVAFGDGFAAAVDGDEATGTYDLNYRPNGTLRGSLAFPGDVDDFRFTIGAPVDLGVAGRDNAAVSIDTAGSLFDTQVALWTAGGVLIASEEDGTEPGSPLQARLDVLLDAGEYVVYVGGGNAGFGPAFQTLVNGDEATGGYLLRVGDRLIGGQTGPGDLYDFFTFEVGATPCNAADVTPAFGVLDVNDVIVFVTAFNLMDLQADVSPPGGDAVLNVNDVIDFVTAFSAGCR